MSDPNPKASTYFSEDLERQRQYVSELEKRGADFPLVAAESFVRGMRDSGYKTTATAIDEFIDNAVQAQADQVDIVLGYSAQNTSKKKLDHESGGYIAVVDNGHGMDPKMIRLAVMWGGTHRENDRTGLGRYGFGLPSAAVSISRSFEVFSRVPGGEWWAVRVDLDEIAEGRLRNNSGNVVVPLARPAELPAFVKAALTNGDLNHGTVVLLDQPDRLTNGFVTSSSFKENILHHVGLVYREFLRSVKMRLVDAGQKIDGTAVEPIDPLFLWSDGRYYDESSTKAEGLPETNFPVKTKDGSGEGTVRVRYSSMPPDFMHQGTARLKVRKENNGFIFLRAGRQIDVVAKNPWHTFINNDRYFGIEINFDPLLDEDFGVTTNKQQITPSERMWEILKNNGVQNALKQLGADYKAANNKDQAAADATKDKPSEKIAATTEKFRKQKAVPPSPSRELESQKELEAEVARIHKETGKPKEQIVDEIESKRYKVDYEHFPGAPFFRMLQVGGQRRLLINTAHRFYSDLYGGPALASKRVKTALELLLFVLGECELDTTPEKEKFYRFERNEWSRRLDIMLEELNSHAPIEDVIEANDPALVRV